MDYKCPHCQSEHIRVMFDAMINSNIENYHSFTKKAIKTKDVELWGVDRSNRTIICRGCQRVLSDGVHFDAKRHHENNLLHSHSCLSCDGRGYHHDNFNNKTITRSDFELLRRAVNAEIKHHHRLEGLYNKHGDAEQVLKAHETKIAFALLSQKLDDIIG